MLQLNKKILLLTMRLGSNYGGIIQAYALQSFISKKGFDTYTSSPSKPAAYKKESIDRLKRYILRIVLKKDLGFIPTENDLSLLTRKTSKFKLDHVKTINLPDKNDLNSYHAVIVGSDQVWRASYVAVPDYLLSFIDNDNIKKISYAASFGKDDLSEYSPELIKETAMLAKKFDAISVREDSGVNICKKEWGVDAKQLIDPTLLIQKKEYIDLINKDKTNKSNGNLFAYILDRNDDKQVTIDQIAKKLDLKPFEIMPPTCGSRKEFRKNIEKFILPPVTQWLKSFDDAEFVVTDSFHGCVFSIIFNKPFIAIGNEGRGLTRFTSLLKVFKLENRLILKSSDLTDSQILSNIDWNQINNIIELEQKRSRDFLDRNLKNESCK